MTTIQEYTQIPSFRDRGGVSNPANYRKVPSDWLVFLSDIRGSTKAIEAGKYKDVNLVGVACITAVKNACKRAEIPYVFGGDGASFLVPPEFDEVVQQALLGAKNMASKEFAFDLRVRRVPVSLLDEKKYTLHFGRYQVSENLTLAVFAGEGLTEAERLSKAEGVEGDRFRFSNSVVALSDFQGLECRWQPIASEKGEILSVLLKVIQTEVSQSQALYRDIIEELELILGSGKADMLPLQASKMRLTTNPRQLSSEVKIRSTGLSTKNRFFHFLELLINTTVGYFLIRFSMKAMGRDWGQYTGEVIENSDFWKYDDMLRFVVDVSPVQKRALMACLESRKMKGDIAFGVHSSKEALMTCYVENRTGAHAHFIDGGEGGYALAAKQMKEQSKNNP